MENLTGKQLGPYQVLAPLGEGGMASVYKAFQPGVERVIALKVLPRHLAKDAQFIERFNREAKTLAKLQHPYILPVFDHGETDGYTYIAMPYIQGQTLTDLLKGEPLSYSQIKQIIAQVGDALDYAHSQKVIHRDIKPSNILIDPRGNCMLSDFGIAHLMTDGDKLTQTGQLVGTPAYMSPEQGQGVTVDQRTDIYALGVILYEMVVGRVPFKAETPLAIIVKHIHSPLPLPSSVNPDIPEAVEQVILKTLAKAPADRYETAGSMVKALEAAFEVQPTPKTMVTGASAKVARKTMISGAMPHLQAKSEAQSNSKGFIKLFGAFGIILAVMAFVILGGLTAVYYSWPLFDFGLTAPSTPLSQTDFPLPSNLSNFNKAAKSERVSYQTNLTILELREFYRKAFTELGFTERQNYTQSNNTNLTMMFDFPSGKQTVVVSVADLGMNSSNDSRLVVIYYGVPLPTIEPLRPTPTSITSSIALTAALTEQPLFAVTQNDKMGYIDRTGQLIIPPQFEWAGGFAEGRAQFKVSDKWGYIDPLGQVLIKPQFDQVGDFSAGLAWVMINHNFGYIDKTGKLVIKLQFDYAGNFAEGLATVRLGDKWGYINPLGEQVIAPQFNEVSDFSEGLAKVKIGRSYGYIDPTGKTVIQPGFIGASKFSEGLAMVTIRNKWGYLDKLGQMVIQPQFEEADDFSAGLAAVQLDKKYGYINARGELVIKPQFERALRFSEGLALVQVGDKWGYINPKGEIVIKPQFDGVDLVGFSKGLASVNVNGQWGYIDLTGKFVWKP